MPTNQQRQFNVLLTAGEAYPALEREFLRAKHDITAGFRVFDPSTMLRSDEALAIGSTWFDLLVDTLNRGVRITLTISDFDPVARMGFHIHSWNCVRAICAAAEVSNNPSLLKVTAAMHPARVGLVPRLLLWRRAVREIRSSLHAINKKPADARKELLARAPFVKPLVKFHGDKLVARRFPTTAALSSDTPPKNGSV